MKESLVLLKSGVGMGLVVFPRALFYFSLSFLLNLHVLL